MNNQVKNLKSKKEILKDLDWLYKNDLNKYYFIKALVESASNKNKTSISMSLNKSTHSVKVRVGDYVYIDSFKTLEEAEKLIDMVKYFKSIV